MKVNVTKAAEPHAIVLSDHSLAVAAIFGLMHVVVDFSSSAVLVWGIDAERLAANASSDLSQALIWSPLFLYLLLAFAIQFSLGAILDCGKAYWAAILVSLAMLGVAVIAVPVSPMWAIVLAALGNAIFHVGAGALVLWTSAGKTAPGGIFVGPGEVGLAIGLAYARAFEFLLWPLLGLLAVSLVVVWAVRKVIVIQYERSNLRTPLPKGRMLLCTVAILLVVAMRSADAQSVAAIHKGVAPALWGLAIATCLGNILGGLIADRLGWLATGVTGLLVAAGALGLFVDNAAAAIVGMAFLQMTMPITLAGIWHLFPAEAGLAFGLTALAFLLGVVPRYAFPSEWNTSGYFLLLVPVLSGAALVVGLLPMARNRALMPRFGEANTGEGPEAALP